jgi:hypothetical protein
MLHKYLNIIKEKNIVAGYILPGDAAFSRNLAISRFLEFKGQMATKGIVEKKHWYIKIKNK